MEEFKESQVSKQDETRPVEVPETEPETQPEPPKKKKKVLSEKQLEALKKGREMRWKKKRKSEALSEPQDSPKKVLKTKPKKKVHFQLEEDITEFSTDDNDDLEALPSKTPKLKREHAQILSSDEDSGSSGWVTPEEPSPKPKKSTNKQSNKNIAERVDKYLKRYFNKSVRGPKFM